MANIYKPEFEPGGKPEGFGSRRARIGYELGAELIGVSLWEVPPGEVAYPYHFHYSDEEVVIVLSGRPSLRGPGGVRELEEGEALRSPSARRARTRSATTARRPRPSWRSPATAARTWSSIPTPTRSASASGSPAAAACARSFVAAKPSTTGTARRTRNRWALTDEGPPTGWRRRDSNSDPRTRREGIYRFSWRLILVSRGPRQRALREIKPLCCPLAAGAVRLG